MNSDELKRLAQTNYDDNEDEWDELLERLHLPRTYQPAVAIALKQGCWEGANEPLGYLRVVAKREARKLLFDCGATPASDPLPKEPLALDRVKKTDFEHASVANADEAVDNQAFGVMDRSWFFDPEDRYYIEEKVPLQYRALSDEERDDSNALAIDWDAIARDVGLDDEETMVLKGRAWGLVRSQPDLSKRRQRAIGAAWKRLSRKLPLIRKRLANLKEKDAVGWLGEKN